VAINCAALAVSVPEAGQATLGIWLCAQPAGSVTVQAAHAAGDADIVVSGGAVLTFTVADWNVPQTVTLMAVEDADLVNSGARISLSSAGLATVLIEATERDNDAPQSIVVAAEGAKGGSCGSGLMGLLLMALAGLCLRQRTGGGRR